MNVVWTDEQRQFIRDNANSKTDAVIADELTKELGRKVTLQSVRKQRQKMKLAKCRGRSVCQLVTEKESGDAQ